MNFVDNSQLLLYTFFIMPNNQLIFSDDGPEHITDHWPSLNPHVPDHHFHDRWDGGSNWEGWHPHCHPEPPTVPEPQTLVMVLVGLGLILLWKWRKQWRARDVQINRDDLWN